MKYLAWFLLVLLTAAPLCAKPKVDVRVKVKEGLARIAPETRSPRVEEQHSVTRSPPGFGS
jgi:hypothetical protein